MCFKFKYEINYNKKIIFLNLTKNKNIKLLIFSLLILLFQFIKIFTYTLFFINIK